LSPGVRISADKWNAAIWDAFPRGFVRHMLVALWGLNNLHKRSVTAEYGPTSNRSLPPPTKLADDKPAILKGNDIIYYI